MATKKIPKGIVRGKMGWIPSPEAWEKAGKGRPAARGTMLTQAQWDLLIRAGEMNERLREIKVAAKSRSVMVRRRLAHRR